ncbi:MAG: hypothetical protein Tsb0014_07940 [Pleurocapsa sp.]
MFLISQSFFLASQYIPHGHCYLWQTPLVGLHVLGDGLIAIAYYLIPLTLLCFVRQRQDVPFKNIFILFSAFIISCGTVHVLEIWTLWHPYYWLSGVIKGLTALISLYTALSLIPLIPKALALPSTEKLEVLNQELNVQIKEKEAAEQKVRLLNTELEKRVAQRTSALTLANRDLQKQTQFNEKITELVPNILYIYDLKSHQNVYSNPFLEELLGYSARELKRFENKLLQELIHPEDLDLVQQNFQNYATLAADDYLEIEYRIKDKKGKWHWLHDRNTVFQVDENGQPEQILGIASDITIRKEIQLQSEQLNQQLIKQVEILETRNQERIKLAAMNNFLQACVTLEEAKTALADLIKPLFPNTDGAVYLINNSQDILNAIATWGTIYSKTSFEPNECWALRRSSVHQGNPKTPAIYCHHIHQNNDLSPTLCFPMMAQGDTLGLLYLHFQNTDTVAESVTELGETVAQNIAMAIANLQLQDTLRYQSLRDPLTGLFNRRYLEESLTKEIDRAKRKQQFIGVMIMDIDHFKRFNDTYSHHAGDLVLQKVGAYLLKKVRQYDLACRYGGEELVIIMPDASLENAILRAEEIREGIKQLKLEYEGVRLPQVTVSVGVSCFPDDGINSPSLIRAADKALYQAKKQGRDRVVRC